MTAKKWQNVNLMSLREILKKIQMELGKKDEIRQEIQSSTRRATRLSKQVIFLVHKEKLDEAANTLKEAERILNMLNNLSKSAPDLFYAGAVEAALEEYAEAYIFLKLVEDGRFVDFEEINVPMVSYVLGLADVVGEFRRRALDSLRIGESGRAEECLGLMETIYMELVNLEEIQYLTPGLRRKCDVARRVIEATRGDVTVEVRRTMLENSMRELKETMETKFSQK